MNERRWYVDKFGAGNPDHKGHAKEEGCLNASSSTTASSQDEPQVAANGNLNDNLDDDADHEDESAEEDDEDEGEEEISSAAENEDESIHEWMEAGEGDTKDERREHEIDSTQLDKATAHADEDEILRKSLRTMGAYNMLKTLFSTVASLVKNIEGFKILRRKMLEAREELLLVAQRGERKRERDDGEALMRPSKNSKP